MKCQLIGAEKLMRDFAKTCTSLRDGDILLQQDG
jgi:hypothetical protein